MTEVSEPNEEEEEEAGTMDGRGIKFTCVLCFKDEACSCSQAVGFFVWWDMVRCDNEEMVLVYDERKGNENTKAK